MRLIDVAPMLEFLDVNHYDNDWIVNQYNADWIYSWLESQPTISPDSLVKRGRWMPPAVGGYGCVCSECKKQADGEFKFCPNCGAKMDESGALMKGEENA